ncbi:MAG: DHHA1 domain-containing protein [Candidatus Woesearchaeota archaeon]
MLTQEQMDEIKNAVDASERPLFFFDDDADGLCSFLQFYKHAQKGKGIVVKATPNLNERFIQPAKNYGPDIIFVLDLAEVSQDFVNEMNCPIYWIDHHDLATIQGVKYYNPKQNIEGDNTCISKLSYDIFREHLWIAATGTIGDWQLPDDLKNEINERMPELFDAEVDTPEKALFTTKIGELAKICNFILKGQTKDVNQAIKVLTRIETPHELLEETSSQGKYLMKRYRQFSGTYDALLARAIAHAEQNNEKLLVFTYEENKNSMSGELSNELLFRYPDKVIVIARHHHGEMKTSFRSGKHINVKKALEKAIKGISGHVGGHEQACGGMIHEDSWEMFISQLRSALEE